MRLNHFCEYGSFNKHLNEKFSDWSESVRQEIRAFDHAEHVAALKAERDSEQIIRRMSVLADYFNAVWRLYVIRDESRFSFYCYHFDYNEYKASRQEYNAYVLELASSSNADVAWSARMCLAAPLYEKENCCIVSGRNGWRPFGDVEALLKLLRKAAIGPDDSDDWNIWACNRLVRIAGALSDAYESISAINRDNYRYLNELAENAAVLAIQTCIDLDLQPRNLHALMKHFRGPLYYQCLMEGPLDLDDDGVGYWGFLGLTDEQKVEAALHGKTASVRRQVIDVLDTEQYVEFLKRADDLSGVRIPDRKYRSLEELDVNRSFARLRAGEDEELILKIALSNADKDSRTIAIEYLRTPESMDQVIEKHGVEVINYMNKSLLTPKRAKQVYYQHSDEYIRGIALSYVDDQEFICKEAFKKEHRETFLFVYIVEHIEDQRVLKDLLFADGGRQAGEFWGAVVKHLEDEEVIREAIAEVEVSHPKYRERLVKQLPKEMWEEFGYEAPDDDDVSLYDANGYPYMDEFEYMNNL